MNELTQEELKRVLHYNPLTGIFIRIKSKRTYLIGKEAGYQNSKFYVIIKIGTKPYKAHRLAWLYMYGVQPKYTIDHKNRIRNDNRLVNLRDVTLKVNCNNRINSRVESRSSHWN